jgi:hypothetical protein
MNGSFSQEYCGNNLASRAEQLMSRVLIIRKLTGERFPIAYSTNIALRNRYYAQGAAVTTRPTKKFITMLTVKFKFAYVYVLQTDNGDKG